MITMGGFRERKKKENFSKERSNYKSPSQSLGDEKFYLEEGNQFEKF